MQLVHIHGGTISCQTSSFIWAIYILRLGANFFGRKWYTENCDLRDDVILTSKGLSFFTGWHSTFG